MKNEIMNLKQNKGALYKSIWWKEGEKKERNDVVIIKYQKVEGI